MIVKFKQHWKEIVGVLMILIISFGLRSYGTSFGFPYLYHPDELTISYRALNMLRTKDANPYWFYYPTLYIYTQAFLYGIYFLSLPKETEATVFSELASSTSRAELLSRLTELKRPPEFVCNFFKIGRIFTALLGTLSVLVVYLVGKKIFDRRTGIIAACFLGISLLHIQCSHYITTDVPMTFFALLAFLFSLHVYNEGKWKDFLLSGIFLGLAVGTKYNAALIVIPLLVAIIFRGLQQQDIIKLCCAGVIAVLAFIIVVPIHVLLHYNGLKRTYQPVLKLLWIH